MSHENVELVKRFIAPPETDYTVLFGDDDVWSAAKEAGEHLVAPDFEGAFIVWGKNNMSSQGSRVCGRPS
jgi:hypothetical protein